MFAYRSKLPKRQLLLGCRRKLKCLETLFRLEVINEISDWKSPRLGCLCSSSYLACLVNAYAALGNQNLTEFVSSYCRWVFRGENRLKVD